MDFEKAYDRVDCCCLNHVMGNGGLLIQDEESGLRCSIPASYLLQGQLWLNILLQLIL